jgi:hypothetical protein
MNYITPLKVEDGEMVLVDAGTEYQGYGVLGFRQQLPAPPPPSSPMPRAPTIDSIAASMHVILSMHLGCPFFDCSPAHNVATLKANIHELCHCTDDVTTLCCITEGMLVTSRGRGQ